MAFVFTSKGQFNRNTVALYVVSTRVYPRLLFWKTQCIKYVNTELLPIRERSPSSIAQTKRLWLYKQIIAVHVRIHKNAQNYFQVFQRQTHSRFKKCEGQC